MKAAFLILSTINSNPSNAANALAQLEQCLTTLSESYELSPNAVIEYSDPGLNEAQKQSLLQHADLLAEFRPNELITKLKEQRLAEDNPIAPESYQELLKIVALNWFLQNAQSSGLFKDMDYIVLLDSHTELENGIVNLLNQDELIKNKFFFKKALSSQIPGKKALAAMYYPTEQWAYSADLTDELIDHVIEASENAYKLLESGSDDKTYTCLGHELFDVVDLARVHFLV